MAKFGLLTGNDHGRRVPVKAGQYYAAAGAAFVTAVNGVRELVTTAAQKVDGYAHAGKLTYWEKPWFLTVANPVNDELLITSDADTVYRVPAKNAVTAADGGRRYCLGYTGTVDSSTFLQYVVNDGSDAATAQVVVQDIDDYDVANQCLKVKLA